MGLRSGDRCERTGAKGGLASRYVACRMLLGCSVIQDCTGHQRLSTLLLSWIVASELPSSAVAEACGMTPPDKRYHQPLRCCSPVQSALQPCVTSLLGVACAQEARHYCVDAAEGPGCVHAEPVCMCLQTGCFPCCVELRSACCMHPCL
jgi:hypothetical protein